MLAALTVGSSPGVGCPEQGEIVERLRAAGVAIREDDDVRVEFSFANGSRVAEIAVPGATPRRIEHAGPDCASLADATIALLGVLLDERASSASRAPAPPPSPAPPPLEASPVFRGEAGALFSSGIVAPFAAGATIGVAWRPVRWGSLGVSVETWPERDHALREGTVTLSASTLALVACSGQTWRALTVEGCLLGHGGYYSLSASDFPVVRPTGRALFGGEAALRAALAVTKGFGVFVRAGVWLPFVRLDVTARGVDSGFTTTSLGPKGVVGLELNP